MQPFFEVFRGLGLALFLVFAAGCVRNQPPPDTVSQVFHHQCFACRSV